MRILQDGTIYLETGEIVPVYCSSCSGIYVPEKDSTESICPECGNRNKHNEYKWKEKELDSFQN